VASFDSKADGVLSLVLINADTDQPVPGFNPVPNGATIDLNSLPSKNLSFIAVPTGSTVRRVDFDYDAGLLKRSEKLSPFALYGDNSGNILGKPLEVGSHTLKATPYFSGSLVPGTPTTISFTITAGSPPPSPTPSPSPRPSPSPTPLPSPKPSPSPTSSVSAPLPSRDPSSVYNSDGTVNVTNYRLVASKYGTDAMIPFRFGQDWRAYNAIDPAASSPTWWERPHNFAQRTTNPSERLYWEITDDTGGYSQTEVGDFSSTQGAVAYTYDPNIAVSRLGVDSFAAYQQGRHVIAQSPQRNWTYSNHPAPELRDRASNLGYANEIGVVALTRAYGFSEASSSALIVYQTGQIATTAMNTANYPFYTKQLPANLVPVAASVTNMGEFALIPCWDTTNVKGVLAVFAMGAARPDGTFWRFEWHEVYPGFRNYSDWSFMKYLGSVDLPGMKTPTSVEAVGSLLGMGNRAAWLTGSSHYGQPGGFPLSVEANWATLKDGGINTTKFDHYGFALVASRWEKKVIVLDLKPLFQKIKAGMFTTFAQFRANVANTGMGETQWPPTFGIAPDFKPTVVKTLTFNSPVTDVSASLSSDNVGLVATDDGMVHVFNMDGLQTGGSGANITEVANVKVGRNITRLTHMKHLSKIEGDPSWVRYQFVALSRGDKRIDWIDFSSGWASPRVVRTLRDSRMVDPIGVEDAQNHSIRIDLLNIADYGAKNVRAYRYGTAWWITWNNNYKVGCGIDETDPFEYGGHYSVPTGPWGISSANVP
jgi:hypothetical protein